MPRLKLKSVTRRAKRTLRPVQDVAEQSAQRALLHALGALDAATRRAAQARRTLEALLLRDRPGLHHELALRAAKLGREDTGGTVAPLRPAVSRVAANAAVSSPRRRVARAAEGAPGEPPPPVPMPSRAKGGGQPRTVVARKTAPATLSARTARATPPDEGTDDTPKISVSRKQPQVKRGQKRR